MLSSSRELNEWGRIQQALGGAHAEAVLLAVKQDIAVFANLRVADHIKVINQNARPRYFRTMRLGSCSSAWERRLRDSICAKCAVGMSPFRKSMSFCFLASD